MNTTKQRRIGSGPWVLVFVLGQYLLLMHASSRYNLRDARSLSPYSTAPATRADRPRSRREDDLYADSSVDFDAPVPSYEMETKKDTTRMSSISSSSDKLPRAHRIDRSKLPYKCGLVFFYHVPSTGGATINQWLLDEYTAPRIKGRQRKRKRRLDREDGDENISRDEETEDGGGGNGSNEAVATYFTQWGRNKDGSATQAQKAFVNGNDRHGGMGEFVRNIQRDEWRIAHCHHSSLHLNVSEHLLSSWRSAVEEQGCAFVANVMFRDPLSHAMSLYKHVDRFNSSRDVWTEHLGTKSRMGYWQTQLDYFLYNFIARNPVSCWHLFCRCDA